MRRRSPALVFAVLIGLAAAGCETTTPVGPSYHAPPPPPPPPPPRAPTQAELLAAEFAWSTLPGTNAVVGDIAYRAQGASWTCAGQSVGLAPETPTSEAHIRALYGSAREAVEPVEAVRARNAASPGADISRWVRTTTCDPRGAFAFNGLPNGAYFVFARGRPRGRGGASAAGLVFMQRVEVRGGEVRRLVLPERAPPR